VVLIAVPSCRKPAPSYTIVAGKEGYTHRISEGETLELIAERYYGDPDLGKALGEYNDVDPLRQLAPGSTLLVPFDRSDLDKIKTNQEAQMLYNRGTVLAKTGQYEDALAYLERAVDVNPSHVDAWYNLALAYHRLDRPQDALDILQKLANSFPSEKSYRYSLGAALRQMRMYDEALREFERALDIDDEYREAQYALALTCGDLGKRKRARKEWERYLDIDPESIWSEEARLHLKDLRGR
jgi:tetratricopeptide (TPR) repeat protein